MHHREGRCSDLGGAELPRCLALPREILRVEAKDIGGSGLCF